MRWERRDGRAGSTVESAYPSAHRPAAVAEGLSQATAFLVAEQDGLVRGLVRVEAPVAQERPRGDVAHHLREPSGAPRGGAGA